MADKRRGREGAFESVGESVGGMAGRAAGRATDMAVDVAGSIVGSAAKMLGGWWADGGADRAARSFGEPDDRACRDHFDSRRRADAPPRDYPEARPLYQFGYAARHNPEYAAKPFDQVESELERAWARAGHERFGEWDGVRDYVGFGYDRPGTGHRMD